MILRTARITYCVVAAILVTANLDTATATAAPITAHKTTYWKKLIVDHRRNGLTVVTRTFYSSQQNGPVMSEIENRGKFEQYSLSRNGLVWFEYANYSCLSAKALIDLVKLRSQQIGYSRVRRLAGWPTDIHPFPFNPNWIPTKPPTYYVGKTVSKIGALSNVGTDVFEGHKCLILQQRALNRGSAGKRIDRFWWSVHNHIIWKETDTDYPPPNSANPPTRHYIYLKWVRPMRRKPAQVFRFPATTKVVIPGILGNLPAPPGGIKIKPPATNNPYIGVDLKPNIQYLESVKGTKNEVHFYKPGNVPKNGK